MFHFCRSNHKTTASVNDTFDSVKLISVQEKRSQSKLQSRLQTRSGLLPFGELCAKIRALQPGDHLRGEVIPRDAQRWSDLRGCIEHPWSAAASITRIPRDSRLGRHRCRDCRRRVRNCTRRGREGCSSYGVCVARGLRAQRM